MQDASNALRMQALAVDLGVVVPKRSKKRSAFILAMAGGVQVVMNLLCGCRTTDRTLTNRYIGGTRPLEE